MPISTCLIEHEGFESGFARIETSDFDPETHTLHEDNPDEVIEELTEQGEDQGSGGDEGSDTDGEAGGAEGGSEAESDEEDEDELAFEDLPRSEKLAEAGYDTVEKVAGTDPDALLEVDGFGKGSLDKLTAMLYG